MNEPKISVRNLYKIFGAAPLTALQEVLNGADKTALLKDHRHVLGLKNINIDFAEGQISVIMGLSGSGKSTLVRHFNRLIEPTTGEILMNGADVMKMGEAELRQLRQTAMSMVFQKFALLPHRTIIQNTAMPLRVRGDSDATANKVAGDCLSRVGLSGYEDHFPQQLSGGMQQRVGLARALASNSDVMLMDEAFSALDPLIRTDMQDLLLELQKDLHKTVVFITHDLDESLKLADYLVILKDGYVVQDGNPQDILSNPCDRYIEKFVQDINRARVLRVASIMQPVNGADIGGLETIEHDQTLETVIAKSGGDTSKAYVAIKNGEPVGQLNMNQLFRALVPRTISEDA